VKLRIFRIVIRIYAVVLALGLCGCFLKVLWLPPIEEDVAAEYNIAGGCNRVSRVAVVPFNRVDIPEGYGRSRQGNRIAETLSRLIKQNVKNVQIVSPAKVVDFLRYTPYKMEPDWAKLAEECGADFVVHGTIMKFTDRDKNFIHARRGVLVGTVYVYNAKTGEEWTRDASVKYPPPTLAGFERPSTFDERETIDLTRRSFCLKVARYFYKWRRKKFYDPSLRPEY